jgi:hemoglobin/transferrin/lactoferrin receptor protein
MKMFCRMIKGTPLMYRVGLSLGAGAMISACAICASAQETHAPAKLPAVLVTATRTPKAPFDIPFSVSVVNAAKLEQYSPRTLPEALRDLPSVMIQKTSHGQGSPYLRGFTGFRTMLLVDGIRLNNSTFREGPNQYWNTVDSFALDHLEVVRGPSSVLYGSDAIGGTVNAFSSGRMEFGPGFDWDMRTLYRVSTAESSHIGRSEISGNLDEHFGFFLGGTIKEFGDVRGGRTVGKQDQTGYAERDWDAKLEYRLNENSRLVYGHQTVDLDNAMRTHATVYGLRWNGTTAGTDFERELDQNRDLNYLQYHAENLDGFIDTLHASVSHHLQIDTERRLRSDLRRDYQGYDVNTLGLSLQLESPSPIGRWVYGGEYYHDWVDSYYRRYTAAGALQAQNLQGPVADDATYETLGFFVENHLPLFDGRLELITGGRYDYASADARRVQDPFTGALLSFADSWDTLVGSERLLYHLDEARHWNVFGGASQGFRAPNLSDLTRFDIARTGEQEIPAFNLKPEHYISFEAGVKTSYDHFSAEAVYFYTMIDDMIVRVPTGAVLGGNAVVAKENSGAGHVHGVELSASVKLAEEWTLWSNFTWMEGQLETAVIVGGAQQTEPLSRVMPTTVNYGLRWEATNRRFWAEAASTVSAGQHRLSASDRLDTQRIPPGGTPGYDIYHLRAGWQVNKYFGLNASLENILDADYRIHGSGVNEPGRNLILSAEVKF